MTQTMTHPIASAFAPLRRLTAGAGIALVLTLGATSAHANTVTSNDPDCVGAPVGRVFSVTATTVVKCLAKGVGNINGNNDAINQLGYVMLDKSDSLGDLLEGTLTGTPSGLQSGLSGTFNIAASVFTLYTDIVIAFKSGQGQFDPDWAAFLLADGTTSGSWSISKQQQLSHANIYGKRRQTVPEPGALALVGIALLVAGAARSRRKN
jgi:hypothetical protein